MAINNLRDFSTQWIVGGFLLTCMLSFAISFMFVNNPIGFGDEGINSQFENAQSSTVTLLEQSEEDSDNVLNVTSNTNPEVSDLGSRDSVSTSFSTYGSAKQQFEAAKTMASWVFSGAIGKMLIGVLGGVIGLLAYFFIAKHIRTGE